MLARSRNIVPLVGARTQLAEALGALDVRLLPDEIARIETAVTATAVAGKRCDARRLGNLDSERPS